MSARADDLARLAAALRDAALVLDRHARGQRAFTLKGGASPVTDADHEVDALLRRLLPRAGEGWLSEESPDDAARLACRRVWIVDPLDGTRDFVAGRPEYSVSIALVEAGEPVLGGVCNPATGVTVLGGPGSGLRVEGAPALRFPAGPQGALRLLCSRSEHKRGEWADLERRGDVVVLPVGSVAYKLALVAAGAADATWTLHPKHEWDVAAGVALLRAAGGEAWLPGGGAPAFNRPEPRFPGFAAAAAGVVARARLLLEERRNPS